jgi:hypothetical protein
MQQSLKSMTYDSEAVKVIKAKLDAAPYIIM